MYRVGVRKRAQPESHGRPIGSLSTAPNLLLELQRRAGNRATSGLLRANNLLVQRYAVTGDYALGAVTAGTTLFQSHALDATTRQYTRRRTVSGGGGLSAITETYDPASDTWVAAGTVPVAQPNIRLSENAQFAIPNLGGQSQVAYLAPAEVTAANNRLQGQQATVRLQELAGQLTPTGGAAMRQVTGVVDTAHQAGVQPALGTIGRASQKWLNSVCHEFAKYSAPTVGGSDEDLDIGCGQG